MLSFSISLLVQSIFFLPHFDYCFSKATSFRSACTRDVGTGFQ